MIFTSTGLTGQFRIQPGGIHPEAGQSYHYDDGAYDFWFYVHFKSPPEVDEPTLSIDHATADRFSGGSPNVRPADQPAIQHNIRSYFEKFDILDRPISSTNPAPRIVFTWRMAQ